MSVQDRMRTIESILVDTPFTLRLTWSDGAGAVVDLTSTLAGAAFARLRDPVFFGQAAVGEWGHSVAWPDDVEIGADSLWLDTLEATGRADAARFMRWRLRHGLDVPAAAEALGLTEDAVADYANGDRPVPKTVELACLGWNAMQAA